MKATATHFIEVHTTHEGGNRNARVLPAWQLSVSKRNTKYFGLKTVAVWHVKPKQQAIKHTKISKIISKFFDGGAAS